MKEIQTPEDFAANNFIGNVTGVVRPDANCIAVGQAAYDKCVLMADAVYKDKVTGWRDANGTYYPSQIERDYSAATNKAKQDLAICREKYGCDNPTGPISEENSKGCADCAVAYALAMEKAQTDRKTNHEKWTQEYNDQITDKFQDPGLTGTPWIPDPFSDPCHCCDVARVAYNKCKDRNAYRYFDSGPVRWQFPSTGGSTRTRT